MYCSRVGLSPPISGWPFTKSVGVLVMLRAVPSRWLASTAALASGEDIQVLNASGSRPACVA